MLGWEPGDWGLVSVSGTALLCDPGCMSSPLWAAMLTSVQWQVECGKQSSRYFLALIFIPLVDIYSVPTMYLAFFQALEIFRERKQTKDPCA